MDKVQHCDWCPQELPELEDDAPTGNVVRCPGLPAVGKAQHCDGCKCVRGFLPDGTRCPGLPAVDQELWRAKELLSRDHFILNKIAYRTSPHRESSCDVCLFLYGEPEEPKP